MRMIDELEISYHREMKKNYLMIAVDSGAEQSFESRMMEKNMIEGLLRFRIRREDDCCWFCYEITSRQPLGRLLENKSIGAEQIRRLLLGIAQTLMRMGDYLLTENQILLRPEYIYVRPEDFQPGLCLLPGSSNDFPQEFSRFLQFLLGKADHQDQEAVVLIYGLYRESLKENYGLDNLLQWLTNKDKLDGERDKRQEKPEERGKKEPVRDPVPDRKYIEPFPAKKIIFFGLLPFVSLAALWLWRGETGLRDYGLMTAGISAGVSFVSAAAVFGLWRKGRGTEKISSAKTQPQKSWEVVFDEEVPQREYEADYGGSAEAVSIEKQETDFSAESHTVLLWGGETNENTRTLTGVEGNQEIIPIAYYPFLIGKQESLTDYAIVKDTVSRLHARIDRKDGQYWLTDLNSTNGTTVNGHSLEANETIPLQIGDLVNIADLHFRFQ